MHAQPTPTGEPVGDTQADTPTRPARSIAVGEAVGVIPASYDDILALHDAAGDDRAELERADADHAHIISGSEMAPLWFCGQRLIDCQRDRLPMGDLAQLVWRTGLVRRQILDRRALCLEAQQAMSARFGLAAAGVTVEEYTVHAEITAGGLRFQYRAGDDPAGGHAEGRLELVEHCEACQDGLRRAVLGTDDPWGDLGEALARLRDMFTGPWRCWTCDDRDAEARRAEADAHDSYDPEPPQLGVGERIADALESLAGGLAAIRDGDLPHSIQFAAFHDLVDEHLDRFEARLDDLVEVLDEPTWLGRIWQRLTSPFRRPARAGATTGAGVYLTPDELAESVAAVRREMEARYATVRAGKTPPSWLPSWTARTDVEEQDRGGHDLHQDLERDRVEAVS